LAFLTKDPAILNLRIGKDYKKKIMGKDNKQGRRKKR